MYTYCSVHICPSFINVVRGVRVGIGGSCISLHMQSLCLKIQIRHPLPAHPKKTTTPYEWMWVLGTQTLAVESFNTLLLLPSSDIEFCYFFGTFFAGTQYLFPRSSLYLIHPRHIYSTFSVSDVMSVSGGLFFSGVCN
jgi:hypothetical protein